LTQYTSFDPNVEVIGQNLLSFMQNVEADAIRPILEKHGLTKINPEQWYPMQQWLDVLSDLSQQSGAMFNMVAIGAAISETAIMPPEVEQMSLEQFLLLINDVYQMQHRNGDAGHVKAERLGAKHMCLEAYVPYPDDLEYGTAYGFARRFLPPQISFTVEYDPDTPRRELGGDITLIHIQWE
jgi:hypothetical protein